MANNPLDTPHLLTLNLQCANASAAYDVLSRVIQSMKVDLGTTSDDFDGDDTLIPPGTVIPLRTRSTENPQTIGDAVVKPFGG